jgi:hypothetical protein
MAYSTQDHKYAGMNPQADTVRQYENTRVKARVFFHGAL